MNFAGHFADFTAGMLASVKPNLPQIYLVRHGQTAWSLSGQHTGLSDIPLTAIGEESAGNVGRRLAGLSFVRVYSSPSQRARRTCELAGFGAVAQVDPDLAEWDYGAYEGLTTAQIIAKNPDWQLFRDGAPQGESVADISARADRVVARIRAENERILLFSSGHFLRVLAARWLGLHAVEGRRFIVGTGSVSILGYEHSLDEPVIALWNEEGHV